MPWNMEEADEKIFAQVNYASRQHAHIMVKTIDSDVVVIAIANFHQLVPLTELWIESGAGKSLRFIPTIHHTYSYLPT